MKSLWSDADAEAIQVLLPVDKLDAVALELLARRADRAHRLALVDEAANLLGEGFDGRKFDHSCAHDHPVTERFAIS